MKKLTSSFLGQVWRYFKDHRFNSILIKYFLLLFICLLLPMIALGMWYGNRMKETMQIEMQKKNDILLARAYDNVNSVISSVKKLSYSLSTNQDIKDLIIVDSIKYDTTDSFNNISSTLGVIKQAYEYIDSIWIYFKKSDKVLSELGALSRKEYSDKEGMAIPFMDIPDRITFQATKKYGSYPYLLTIYCPIYSADHSDLGMTIINIDVEELGKYIGSGQYLNKDDNPLLIILDEKRESLIYSDEYLLLREGADKFKVLEKYIDDDNKISQECTLWEESYMVSGIQSSESDHFWYIYLSPLKQFKEQNQEMNRLFGNIIILIIIICIILAGVLSVWVYRPIQRTMHILKDVSLLTEWDKKTNIDEIEVIQRSILSAKEKQDYLNERIQERIVSLHNAQICALQTQINPHFLYNTLESIGNAAAIFMNGENVVTNMVCTLGHLMRISLKGERYLVPIEEELEHVQLYVKLVDFRFSGRICMHIDIPKELYKEKIVKLTLQPLIENAIEHGLRRKREGGDIWIKGNMTEDRVVLRIIDNGEGISDEQFEKLTNELAISSINDSRHIGLRNVNQRLQLVFGEECGLSIQRTETGGICVVVCLKKL